VVDLEHLEQRMILLEKQLVGALVEVEAFINSTQEVEKRIATHIKEDELTHRLVEQEMLNVRNQGHRLADFFYRLKNPLDEIKEDLEKARDSEKPI
jgi:predicted small metal-binding protein